ncbi:MAG TPA: carbohydrate ABC transporter permease [Inquilinus sp.]
MTRLVAGLRWAVFLLAVLILNIPVIVTLLTSLKTTLDINAYPPVWLFAPTLEHYGTVLTDPALDFPRYLMNSTAIALGGTVLALGLGVPAAYAMARLGKGTTTILPVVTNLRALPLVIFAIPFYLLYQALGLLDTRLGLALISCIINLPLALILLVGFLQDLPQEIEEAARVDGASTFAVLRHIVLPLARPVLVAVAILSFIYSWNEFLFGLILTTRNAVPVTVGATFFITSWGVKWGATAAAMMLSVLPPLLLGLVSYRYLGRAMLAGAVKG